MKLGFGANIKSSIHHDNYSLDFDGVDQYITMDGAASSINGAVGTISAWVKLETTSAGCYVLRTQVDGTTNNYIALWYHASNNQTYMTHKGGGTATHAYISAGETIEGDTDWHHLVGTWSESADEVKIYLDGVLKATTGSLGTYSGTNTLCDIGQSTQAAMFWKGLLNEVAVFDRVVSATTLYNSGSPTDLTGMAGLVGYWKIEEGAGTVAIDSSGKGNNGTLTNSPTWGTDTP
jgi:hypothetical protein